MMTSAVAMPALGVVAVHGPGWPADRKVAFAAGVTGLLKAVEVSLRQDFVPVRLVGRTAGIEEASSLLDPLPAVALVDVSTVDEVFASFIGRLLGLGVTCVFLCGADGRDAADRLGVAAARVHLYAQDIDGLSGNASLRRELREAVSAGSVLSEMVYSLWFPRSANAIWVVCPQNHKAGEYADRSSADYTYLDNLGDTDALLELMVFLSSRYPNAMIGYFSAGDLPRGHGTGNLVIVGGPGEHCGIDNYTCQEMMTAIKSRVSYSDDCDRMIVTLADGTKREYEAELDPAAETLGNQARFGLRKDRGYFARFPNPLNENAAVVLVNGIHTRGVLGSGKAFTDRRQALRNYQAVVASGVNPAQFECHFPVRVVSGEVQVPEIAAADIFALGAPTANVPSNGAPVAQAEVTSDSVTVVFVAGDRGNSQINQAQIPRELKGVQDALRACRYRDNISLANTILGASVRTVADANRDGPSVMHFAGHGDDRSLSLIRDENVLVGPTPIDDKQLGEILGLFTKRLRLCVLNTCASAKIAVHLCAVGAVDAAIGWPDKVPDSTAIAFAGALYANLGDGLGIARAVELAAASSDSTIRPQIFFAKEVDGNASLVRGAQTP